MAERWSCASDVAFGTVPVTPSALVGREVYETFYSAFTIGGELTPGMKGTATITTRTTVTLVTVTEVRSGQVVIATGGAI